MYLSEFNSSFDASPSYGSHLVPRNLTSPPDETCYDIRYCRTISSIVWSCVATNLACTWVTIHPNIPSQDAGRMSKLGRRIVTTIYAIIAPELVVVWAAKQWITSRYLADRYQERHKWTQTHGFFAIMGGFVIYKNGEPLRVVYPYRDLDRLGSATPKATCKCYASFDKHLGGHHCDTSQDYQLGPVQMPLISAIPESGSGSGSGSGSEELRPDIRTSSDAEHQFTNDQVDISTLPFPDISKAEIMNMSKGDWISKGLVILQTSWFVIQCIARAVQRLPVTELELATCAFAALNAVTYGLLWNKPQYVDCLYPIGRKTARGVAITAYKIVGRKISLKAYISGIPKNAWGNDWGFFTDVDENSSIFRLTATLVLSPLGPFVNMMSGYETANDSKHVPPYYAGDFSGDGDAMIPTLVVVACATVFGAIHCIGWSFAFPSRVHQLLWRSCSLAITCLPLIEVAMTFLSWFCIWDTLEVLSSLVMINLILYIAARTTLLVLAFVALKVVGVAAGARPRTGLPVSTTRAS